MLGSNWHMRKQKVYNWPSNKSDVIAPRQTCELPTLARHSLVYLYKLGPQNRNHGLIAMIHLRPTSDWPVMLCDRLATYPTHDLGTTASSYQKHFQSDLRWIYKCAEWYTRPLSDLQPTCEDLRPKEDPAASWVTRKWNWLVLRPFLTVKSDHGACRFQWRVSLSYCE